MLSKFSQKEGGTPSPCPLLQDEDTSGYPTGSSTVCHCLQTQQHHKSCILRLDMWTKQGEVKQEYCHHEETGDIRVITKINRDKNNTCIVFIPSKTIGQS